MSAAGFPWADIKRDCDRSVWLQPNFLWLIYGLMAMGLNECYRLSLD
jgi:hypothetical protein